MAENFPACHHCGESCLPPAAGKLDRNGEIFHYCCAGCQAVSELIFSSGLQRYYQFRESTSQRVPPEAIQSVHAWQACDEKPELWGEALADGKRDLLLQAEGVHCAACAWLIRRRLESQPGIDRVQVDVSTGYTRIQWDPQQLRLSDIARELVQTGYKPHLPLAGEEERGRLQARRLALRRLSVAGLGMMQVMMYAVGLYAGDALGISDTARRFLEWISLLVTIPVVFYSGRPFFEHAIASLKQGRVGMDVPVALAIALAFSLSLINFLRGEGAVYFDSVVMFVFFLGVARYLQMIAGHRNLQSVTALARLLPEWADKVDADGTSTLLASELNVGDVVRVKAGDPFPADGTLQIGETEADEGLLTGESRPVPKSMGDPVIAGSINISQPVEVRVTAVGNETAVSALGRRILAAQALPVDRTEVADRLAAAFIMAVLVLALFTAVGWYFFDPGKAWGAVLAVLVVSCPCALSLATPAAVAAASRWLLRHGILLSRPSALEALEGVNSVLLDKTGTLTLARPVIGKMELNPEQSNLSNDQVLRFAAALESHSSHPIAHAFSNAGSFPKVQSPLEIKGQGIQGEIDGVLYKIGQRGFCVASSESNPDGSEIWLSSDGVWLARFTLVDDLREGAVEMVSEFNNRDWQVRIASGDGADEVERVAGLLGIEQWHARQLPEEKLELVREWRRQGEVVLALGDGINDGPVLAGADVSLSVSGAADLARSAADVVLTDDSLDRVRLLLDLATQTRRIIRQNLAWALVYNGLAIPLAVSGLLQPWMAALGMAGSSLLVVANAARLSRWNPAPADSDATAAVKLPV